MGGGGKGVENGAMLTTYYSDILQNAPFRTLTRSQISTIFFALGGKGALTPLTKILRTPLISQLSVHVFCPCLTFFVSGGTNLYEPYTIL